MQVTPRIENGGFSDAVVDVKIEAPRAAVGSETSHTAISIVPTMRCSLRLRSSRG